MIFFFMDQGDAMGLFLKESVLRRTASEAE